MWGERVSGEVHLSLSVIFENGSFLVVNCQFDLCISDTWGSAGQNDYSWSRSSRSFNKIPKVGDRICKIKVSLILFLKWRKVSNAWISRAQMTVLKKGLLDEQDKSNNLSDQVFCVKTKIWISTYHVKMMKSKCIQSLEPNFDNSIFILYSVYNLEFLLNFEGASREWLVAGCCQLLLMLFVSANDSKL